MKRLLARALARLAARLDGDAARPSGGGDDGALRRSEELLREAQALAQVGNWNLDLGSGLAIWSDEEYRLLGYAPGAVTPSAENFMAAVHPADRAAVAAAMERAMDPGTREPYHIEHRVLDPAGERVLEQRGRVAFDDAGRPLRMYGTTLDVTARRRARDESAAKSEFLSRMSHELRTPLNAIIGFSQLMDGDPGHPLSPAQADHLREIRAAGVHLLDLVNEVLDLTRLESGRLEVHLEPLPLAPLLAGCVEQVRPRAARQGVSIALDPPPPDAAVRGDRGRVRQVLLNLLANAIQYNRPGGQVHLGWEEAAPGALRVRVRDTGTGIQATDLPRLFRPFERVTAASEGVQGTGIGLAVAKRLVEAMAGEIGVISTPGEGSTFWFELPRAPAAATSPPRPRDRRPRVLYVEDNPANLKLVRKLLANRREVDFIAAETAEAGLAAISAQVPDLVLLDLNLPGMDGFAALARLRGDPATRRIPVVAVTANAMPRDLDQGRAAGFDDYLTKPIDLERFFQVIDHHLSRDLEVQA